MFKEMWRLYKLYMLCAFGFIPWGFLYAIMSIEEEPHWIMFVALLLGGLTTAHWIWYKFDREPQIKRCQGKRR